jgi:hypothetical protein
MKKLSLPAHRDAWLVEGYYVVCRWLPIFFSIMLLIIVVR